MGKTKKPKHRSLPRKTCNSSSRPYTATANKTKASPPRTQKSPKPPSTPTIPFEPSDRILLVGEGDFSFTYSLHKHHNCTSLLATSYDNAAVLAEKYPQSESYIAELEEAAREDEDVDIKILYSVDATKLGKGAPGGGKVVRRGGFERVVFNFPHVGGLTKDVNRQVRYNQGIDLPFNFGGNSCWFFN